MDLWIRSQDKEKLLKCNDIAIKNHRYDTVDEYGNRCMNFNGYEIVGYFDKNTEYEILGIYETKERALEVLDEIQQHIEKQGENYLLSDENGIITGQKYYGYIYQMPKDY